MSLASGIAYRGSTSEPRRLSWDHLRAAQQGDADGFAYLYRRYRRDIYTFLLARTKRIPVAEDLTSETFLRALRKLGSVREQSDDVRAWIMVIARNLAYDHQKSLRVRRESLTDEPIEVPGTVIGTETIVMQRQLSRDVTDALAMLTQPQRTCLFLRFYCGFSVSRTAEAMKRKPGAVRALQHRATRELAKILSGRGSRPDAPAEVAEQW